MMTHKGDNLLCEYPYYQSKKMFKKLIELYKEYKAYVRVDLIMYAVMILMIILYGIYTLVIR